MTKKPNHVPTHYHEPATHLRKNLRQPNKRGLTAMNTHLFRQNWCQKERRTLFFSYSGLHQDFSAVVEIALSIVVSVVHQVTFAGDGTGRHIRGRNFEVRTPLVFSLF